VIIFSNNVIRAICGQLIGVLFLSMCGNLRIFLSNRFYVKSNVAKIIFGKIGNFQKTEIMVCGKQLDNPTVLPLLTNT